LPGFLEEVCSRTSARRQQMHGFQSSSCCVELGDRRVLQSEVEGYRQLTKLH